MKLKSFGCKARAMNARSLRWAWRVDVCVAVAVALTAALLPACLVPSLSDAASKTFTADNNCAAPAVVERGRNST